MLRYSSLFKCVLQLLNFATLCYKSTSRKWNLVESEILQVGLETGINMPLLLLTLLYGVGHMVKNHLDYGKRNPLPPHGLLLPISSKGSFICPNPQTG